MSKFQEADVLLESMLENSQDAVFILSADSNASSGNGSYPELTYINPRFESLMGYTLSQIKGNNWSERLFPREHNRQELALLFANALPAAKPVSKLWALSSSTSAFFWGEVTFQPVFSREILTYWVVSCRYDADKHAMQSELSKTMRLLTSIIDHIPTPLFIKDANDLSFLMFNKANESLTGYSNEVIIGKNDYDFFPKEQADFFTGIDRQVLSASKRYDIPEEEIVMRDGSKRFLHTVKVPIPDEEGKPVFLLGICEDITDKKLAEAAIKKAHENLEQEVCRRTQELRLSNEALKHEIAERAKTQHSLETTQKYLYHVINRLPIILFAMDRQGIATLSEGKGLEILGVQPGEQLGMNVLDLYRQEPTIIQSVKRALSGEQFSSIDRLGPLVFETHWVPNFTENNELDGCYAVSYNITEFTNTEDALRKIQNDLENQVHIRTLELLEANEQLKALDQTRRNLVSTLTHDLRTPLIAQGRVLNIMQHEDPILQNPKLTGLMEGFIRNNADLLQMVNNILETYELEDGRIRANLEPVDLFQSIGNVSAELEQLAASRGIQIISNVPQTFPLFFADLMLLKRLFTNLIGNALTNIPAGSVICVHAECADSAIIVTIRDNGQGIPPALLPHLFTRYFSGSATKRKIGTGLGLYICKMIMDLHQGTIQVESTIGKGSVFTLTFPLTA